jgi:beta-lactamase regulating signal transducer with metallopeptidase domain
MHSAFTVPWASLSSGMLFSLAISALVLLAAMAAHDAQRAANRAVRWVWFGGIVAIVMLTVASPLRRTPPPITLRATSSVSQAATSTAIRSRPTLRDRWYEARSALIKPVSAALSTTHTWISNVPPTVHRAVGVLWLLASAVTFGAFVLSYWRVRQTLQHWPVQRVGDTNARIAPTSGPAVVGLAPSQIILPAWLLSRSPEEQRLVVTHESEHVRAGDPWLLVFACGAAALMPWNPALWYALGRLRLAIELDCDRRVLGRGIPTASYGALLIDLSALRSSLPSAMPAFSCSGSYLERRLVAMTARPSRFSAPRRAVGALIAAAAFVTACESKLPTSAEVNQLDAAGTRELATKASLIEERAVNYFVDGQKVSAAMADKIAAERIASVSVVGKTAGKVGEIRIATKGTVVEVPIGDQPLTFERNSVRVVASPVERAAGSAAITFERKMAVASPVPGTGGGSGSGSSKFVESPVRKFEGLVVIDGRIVERGEMDRLSPDQIASIDIVKGEAAKVLYSDPRAAFGVIKVTMKSKH